MRFTLRLLLISLFVLPVSSQAETPARDMLRFVAGGSAMEQQVGIDLAALGSRRVRIPLLDGQSVVADRSDLEVRAPGDFAWRGRIGESDGDVTLTVRNGRVLGRIVVPGTAYRIVPTEDGGHRMVKVDEETPLEEVFDLVPASALLEAQEDEEACPASLPLRPARRRSRG